MQQISAEQFAQRYHEQGANLTVVDVRTVPEYRQCHVQGALPRPLAELDPEQLAAELQGCNSPVYLLCKAGARAQQAAERLAACTALEVVVVNGGTDACIACQLPLNHGETTVISLERQVRIAAGSLVLLGTLIGLWWPPVLALAIFVGAGLVFAGVTDHCGMALLLARLPWNRR